MTAGKLVRSGRHRCWLPSWGNNGDVWECDCGRRWKFNNPGNPAYARWRRLLFNRF